MARNQLPEGVGKKIVEALKRQAEADVTPVASMENSIREEVTDADFDALQETSQQITGSSFVIEDNNNLAETFSIQNDTQNVEEETAENTFDVQKMKDTTENTSNEMSFNFANEIKTEELLPENTFDVQNNKEETVVHPVNEPVPETPLFKINPEPVLSFKPQTASTMASYSSSMPLSEEPKKSVVSTTVSIRIPQNVAVLRNLIASLPVGVTKQTGAQIIRQTLEAMGLPMAGVLKEAQEVQEELNTNTRECMLKIQEYKTNIMQLEQSVQEYQKNVTQINDLVSLFLLTDRK